jgi:hypothetical protein
MAPKPISLAMSQIGVGVKVISIDIITYAYEVFKTLKAMLKRHMLLKNQNLNFIP